MSVSKYSNMALLYSCINKDKAFIGQRPEAKNSQE